MLVILIFGSRREVVVNNGLVREVFAGKFGGGAAERDTQARTRAFRNTAMAAVSTARLSAIPINCFSSFSSITHHDRTLRMVRSIFFSSPPRHFSCSQEKYCRKGFFFLLFEAEDAGRLAVRD